MGKRERERERRDEEKNENNWRRLSFFLSNFERTSYFFFLFFENRRERKKKRRGARKKRGSAPRLASSSSLLSFFVFSSICVFLSVLFRHGKRFMKHDLCKASLGQEKERSRGTNSPFSLDLFFLLDSMQRELPKRWDALPRSVSLFLLIIVSNSRHITLEHTITDRILH